MGLPLLCSTNARASGCAAHGRNLYMLNSFPSVDLEYSLHSCHHHILLPNERSKDFDDHKRNYESTAIWMLVTVDRWSIVVSMVTGISSGSNAKWSPTIYTIWEVASVTSLMVQDGYECGIVCIQDAKSLHKWQNKTIEVFFFSLFHISLIKKCWEPQKKVFGIREGKNTKIWINALSLVAQLYSIRRKFHDLSKHHKINLKLIVTTSPLLRLILVFMIDFHLKKIIREKSNWINLYC